MRADSALRTAFGKEDDHILSKALVAADAHTPADLSASVLRLAEWMVASDRVVLGEGLQA
jgi:hypothetical protein